MRDVTIALVQLHPQLGAVNDNLDRMGKIIQQICTTQRTNLIVFPELSLTGYFLRDMVPEVALGRTSLEIAEALAKRDPQNPVWQHDLSVSHDRIGDILDKKGDREQALESFRKGLAIAKALTLRDGDNVRTVSRRVAIHPKDRRRVQ
jgi:hypothetical protein